MSRVRSEILGLLITTVPSTVKWRWAGATVVCRTYCVIVADEIVQVWASRSDELSVKTPVPYAHTDTLYG
jgi:hypothetical protein